jgi:hypothetical protein
MAQLPLYESTSCEVDVNRLKLLGQDVRVFKNGIVWTDPDTGLRCMIGKTRLEAEAELREWQRTRSHTFAARKPVNALPRRTAGERIERIYWKSYYAACDRARKAGRPYMSKLEFAAIVERAGGQCEVSGIAFSDHRPPGARVRPWAPSIDRIECAQGYSASNCRLVCAAVNLAINEFGTDVFTKIALAVGARPVPPFAAHKGGGSG